MWIEDYDSRLRSYRHLRSALKSAHTERQMELINEWWSQAPEGTNIIHWQDKDNWPNPWELLAESVYDELAKALGIVYTILFVDSTLTVNIIRAMDTNGNDCIVVSVNNKYILNWDSDSVISTPVQEFTIHETYDCNALKEKVA